MNHYSRLVTETNFIRCLISHVPELNDTWTRALDEMDGCIPAFTMREITHQVVDWVRMEMTIHDPNLSRAVQRSFAYFDAGMRQGQPIADFLRHTVCDVLGAQSVERNVFNHLLRHIGPPIKRWLVCADGSMPFRTQPGIPWSDVVQSAEHTKNDSLATSDIEDSSMTKKDILLTSSWSHPLSRIVQSSPQRGHRIRGFGSIHHRIIGG